MPEVLLHHYEMSPFARKLRLAFGLKQLAWGSVAIPMVMPKPDLTELTGGYRRTPVMQVGADIYCDTKLCAEVLERLHPTPSLFPDDATTVWALAHWAETSFMPVVTALLALGAFDQAFVDDRQKMMPDVDFSRAPLVLASKLLLLRANLDRLERQLSDGRPFLHGDRPSLADLAGYHPHVFMERQPRTAQLLQGFDRVRSWLSRVADIGEGQRSEVTPAQAIETAAAAQPVQATEHAPMPDGLAVGDAVVVLSDEPGSGVVAGELLPSGLHEIAIRRVSERAGKLTVHFPREGYTLLHAR